MMLTIDDNGRVRVRVRKRQMAVGLPVAALLLLFLPYSAEGSGSYTPFSGRPFAATSAFNAPIGGSVTLDPDSTAMVRNVSSGVYPGIANLYAYGYPVYYADSTTPRYRIDCTILWGTCDLEREMIPIPDGARANTGSDGKLEIIDLVSGKAYEFWQYQNDFTTTSWGYINPDIHSGDSRPGATGAGISQAAGMVRISDVKSGLIDHALTFSTKFCQGPDNGPHYRYPATKTDGKWFGAGAVPEGARIQLDPAVNVAAIPGITAGEQMVARALQTYGAYAVDCGAAPMAFAFEAPKDGSNPYPGIGFPWDYYGMDHIPWDRLRVLAAWDSHSNALPPTTPPTPLPPTMTTTTPPPTMTSSPTATPPPPVTPPPTTPHPPPSCSGYTG